MVMRWCRFGADFVFDHRRSAAGVPMLDVDEFVRDGAAALVLLETVVQPDKSDAVRPSWSGMRTHAI